jgi:hypothetical protein
VRFFLATDNEVVRRNLEAAYPGRLLPNPDGTLFHIGLANQYPSDVMTRMTAENYLLGKKKLFKSSNNR